MTHTQTNKGEMPLAGEMPILVTINGIPTWQSQSGRTFPQVAGAEDPPAGANTEEAAAGDDDAGGSADDFDKDRAFATIQKQRADLKALKERERTAARERDELKAKQRERDEAELSETERLKARTAELEREKSDLERTRQEEWNVRAIERAATKAGATDPDDVFKLLNQSEFEHDADGNVTNAEKLVAALLKAKPYLVGKSSSSGVPGTPRSNGTQSHEDRVKENIEKLRASGVYDPL
jgi:hypothetical protein